MKIALFHGYELKGSGSNEYNRYLAKTLAKQGNEVHIICREAFPEKIDYIDQAIAWENDVSKIELFCKKRDPQVVLHQLPHGKIRPVYVTDKQREGHVKPFSSLTDEELDEYHQFNEDLLHKILDEYQFDILHVNHMVYQPMIVKDVCKKTRTPYIIFPHGSSIEYTIKEDHRYLEKARHSIKEVDGLIIGNQEVTDRIINTFPELADEIIQKTQIVGVGVDTSLFVPISRNQRRNSIDRLISLAEPECKGKSKEQFESMIEEILEKGVEAAKGRSNDYPNDYPDKDFCQKMEQISWEDNILIFVGSLTVGKGLQTLITALPEILSEQPDTQLLIVGSGAYREVLETLVYAVQNEDIELIKELAAKGKDLDRNDLKGPWEDVVHYLQNPDNIDIIKKYGKEVKNRVHFLGRLDHELLPHLFPLADLAIFPSVIPEAYPLVLMESLSNGVLPIVSYFSGFKDGIDDLNPFLGEQITDHMKIPTDPQTRVPKLSQNIQTLLKRASSQEIKDRLRAIAEEHYDWEIKAREMAKAYAKVVENQFATKE